MVPPVVPPRPNPPHCRYGPPRASYPWPPFHRSCGRCWPTWRPQRRPWSALAAAAPRRPGCCDGACNPVRRRSPERPDLALRCSGRLSPPRQSRGQLCSRWEASGKLRGALKRRFARGNKTLTLLVVTIVVYVATVSPYVRMNGSKSVCTRPGTQWSCRHHQQGESSPERAHGELGGTKPRYNVYDRKRGGPDVLLIPKSCPLSGLQP